MKIDQMIQLIIVIVRNEIKKESSRIKPCIFIYVENIFDISSRFWQRCWLVDLFFNFFQPIISVNSYHSGYFFNDFNHCKNLMNQSDWQKICIVNNLCIYFQFWNKFCKLYFLISRIDVKVNILVPKWHFFR